MKHLWNSKNDLLFPSIEKTKIPERIIEAFKAKIYAKELLPGDQLPTERELIAMFGVGRSSVREALKALTYMGFIEAKQGNGYFMKDTATLVGEHWTNYCQFNNIPLQEYIDARYAIESAVVQLAATRATESEVEYMHSLALQFSQQFDEPVKLIETDCELHLAIARSTGNRVLLEMLNTTRKLMSEYIYHVVETPGRIQRGAEEHLLIVQAIREKNPEKAAHIMRTHVGKFNGNQMVGT